MTLRSTLILLAATCSFTAARAEVVLPKILSSHMVIQRNMPIHVWGFASPAEQVNVSFRGSTASTTADNIGRWSVYLPAQPAGGPFTLTIRGTNTIQLDDILLGDLWVASGQSNMEMPLAGFATAPLKDSEKEIAAANHPEIRLLRVERDSTDYPLDDLKAAVGWSACTPETARNFSAVAYFFARDLQQHQHVAIGLIDSTWGGTPADSWTSLAGIASDAGLMPVFSARAERMSREAYEMRLDQVDQTAKAQGKPMIRSRDGHTSEVPWRPATLFNAMIAPLTPLPIRGVIWYQGESNTGAGYVELYSRLFPAMIQDWRRQWHQGDFPFLFVQLSAFGNAAKDSWGILRDSQRRTLSLANTGMAVTLDYGNQTNVHPAEKQIVGERLSLLGRSIAYGEKITAFGPLFLLAYPEGSAMHVWFDYANGLTAKGGTLEGFEIAGSNGEFVPATGKVEGDTVIVSSSQVAEPRFVRYAWANYPTANLYNRAGLPASTFTSFPVP